MEQLELKPFLIWDADILGSDIKKIIILKGRGTRWGWEDILHPLISFIWLIHVGSGAQVPGPCSAFPGILALKWM